MSEFAIEVDGGKTVRLPTAGKYCDRDIQITAKAGDTESAYNQGYKDGGNGVLSMATGLSAMFNEVNLPAGTDIEVYCPNFIKFVESIACNSVGLRKLTLICDDTSGELHVGQAFYGSSIEVLDITKFNRKIHGAVNWLLNAKITTILGALDCSDLTKSPVNFFVNCSQLADVTFEPETIGFSISIKQASLSVESGKSVILGLKNFKGTESEYAYTLSLHENTWALLDAEGATAPGGVTWREYVQYSLCWNI